MKHSSSRWPSSTQLGYSPDYVFVMNTKHPSVITENTPRTGFQFSNVLDKYSDFSPLPSQSTPIVLPLFSCPRLLSQRISVFLYQDAKPTILLCFWVGILSHILPGVTAEGYKYLQVAHGRAKLRNISRCNTSRLTKLYLLLQHTRTTASVLRIVYS